MIRNRVFVVGCPRSGTTLVQAILASSPRVFSLPETHFFTTLYASGNRWFRSYAAERELEQLCAEHLQIAPFRALPTLSRRLSVQRFRRWMDAQTVSAGCDVWVEKTPLHLRHIEQIGWHEGLRDARYVHVVRNVEDTVRSLMQAGRHWGWPRTVREALDTWIESLRLSLHYVNNERHHFVNYEQLLIDGASEALRLFAFVGVEVATDWKARLDETSRRLVSQKELSWKARNIFTRGIVRNTTVARLSDADRDWLSNAIRILTYVTGSRSS